MSNSTQPRALVLRAPGINCDRETVHACRLAGFETDLLHINHLIKAPERLLDYHLLVIPGGFSYGDDLGAGTLLAKNLTIHLGKQLEQFIEDERLVLGICNGFQVLVRAGLLPGHINGRTYRATLTDNASARFECRWITLSTLPGRCVFTSNIDHPIELPVAHGEGQFVFQGDITHLLAYHLVPLLYTAPCDDPVYKRLVNEGYINYTLSGETLPYPYNPNGSLENVAGVCNAYGNVLGLMPHPERYVSALQHPQRKGLPDGTGDGLLLFKNAYEYVSQHTRTSYGASGVNIAAADHAKALMKEAIQATHGQEVLAGMGAFAGVLDITGIRQMRKPALVASTDSVGTKTLIAAQANRYDTIGYDLVNHSVNDLLTQGARPLFFMDYLAMGKLDPMQAATIVGSVAEACKEVGCALLGGETAEMPDVYLPGAFDLAGTIAGVVEQEAIPDNSAICPGDVLLGLPSSGLHTNGYSLARRVFAPYARGESRHDGSGLGEMGRDEPGRDLSRPYGVVFPELGEPLVDVLLRPHRCYLREIQALQAQGIAIKGMAHITGGGFEGNISRILPEGRQAVIETQMWNVPPLFSLIASLGSVTREEMYRTFNMGVGMVLVFSHDEASKAQAVLPELFPVGYVTEGNGVKVLYKVNA